MRTKVLGMALATLLLTASAYADAMFQLGNHPQPNEENILQLGQTGSTIDGVTDHSHTTVQFTSTTDTLVGTGGQSDIDAMDGEINNITISVPGTTFQDLIFNPFKPANNGDLVVTVVTNTGSQPAFTYGSTHGQNFLTITATGGQVIDSVTIDSAGGFQGLKQPRISGIPGVTIVPEPSSLLLLGSGLLGIAGVVRRKSS